MLIRPYDVSTDKDAVHRVLFEVGWLEDKPKEIEAQDAFTEAARSFVGEMDGTPECLVTTMPGTIRHMEDDLSLCCVTGVCTSRIARKQGLAGRTTAHAIAECAADGAETAGLGVFDQGYYNRLGFGTGVYEHEVRFDPADLLIDRHVAPPVRLTRDDWKEMHESRMRSLRRHGSAQVLRPEILRLQLAKRPGAFGLGWRDKRGRLTHHVAIDGTEQIGPWWVMWMAYETYEELLDLLALLKGFEDQVRTIGMHQPPLVQMQDLLKRPFRLEPSRADSKHHVGITSRAFWQLRINDLSACLAKTHLDCKRTTFNLKLTDPITTYLSEDARWKGAGGDFLVTLGEDCSAEPGSRARSQTLSASVNGFTRLWLGVLPATTLSATDEVTGEHSLLKKLDAAFQLPPPYLGWFF